MIFELAQDFHEVVASMPVEHPKHRMLELLGEAIRRDIHFIARHSTTLFQCMWHSCWWYDCPEGVNHYITATRNVTDPNVRGGQRRNMKLCRLLEQWRSKRNTRAATPAWVRSARAPATHLGRGQLASLAGHRGHVTDITFSPDGREVASCGHDGCIRTA